MGDVASVRSTISAAVDALSGWSVSRWGPDLFGSDTDHVMHHTFSVATAETTAHPSDGRQRALDGALVETAVDVQWAHRIRGDAQVADYGDALDAEQDVVKAVKAIPSLHVRFDRASRRAGPEGWLLGTIRFTCLHYYRLAP